DRRNDIVLVVPARLAEPRSVADGYCSNVLHEYRHAVRLGQQHVLDVRDVEPPRQVRRAAAVHKPDAPDIHRLLSNIDGSAADIDVRIADRAYYLRQRYVVGIELIQVDLDLILLCCAAPGIDLHDARHRQQAPLQYPILHGAQVGQTEVL